MTRERTALEITLRKVLDQIQVNPVGTWAWNPKESQSCTVEKKLFPCGPMHKNVVTEICFNVSGRTYLELDGGVVVLQPGQFFVIPAGVLNRECAPKEEQGETVWFNLSKSPRIRVNVTGYGKDGKILLLHTKMVMAGVPVKKALEDTLAEELEGDRFGAVALIKSRLVETLVEMIRQLGIGEQEQFTHQWQETLVAETMDYLYRHGGERTELQDVADHLCISEKQLNRIFKTVTGTTVINYFNQQRILQARYYLISTNTRLKDIAELLSYYDQYHFSRMFKKATGYTPSQFRKVRRGE